MTRHCSPWWSVAVCVVFHLHSEMSMYVSIWRCCTPTDESSWGGKINLSYCQTARRGQEAKALPLPTSTRMPCSHGLGFSSCFFSKPSSVKLSSVLLKVFSIAIDHVSITIDIVIVLSPSPTGMPALHCSVNFRGFWVILPCSKKNKN